MPIRHFARFLTLASALTVAVTACASSPLQPEGGSAARSDTASQDAATLTVSRISPTTGPVGTTVTITGRGFASARNAATFGIGFIRDMSSTDGTTLSFVVPDGLDLCPPDATAPCAGAHPRTKAGDYTVSVMVDGRKSNALTFTVTP